jgi:hypothetical protein
MKYEIIKNGLDDYTLKYKDKVFNYKSNIDLISKLQEAPKLARIEMLKDLAKDGISLKDFTIEQKLNGKTYFDNTNKNELENTYIQNKMVEIINNVCKDNFKLGLTELILDIGLETNEEQERFSGELGATLMGKSPSSR